MEQIKQYDAIVPIGMTCATASQLKKRNLRRASFPFDWILIPPENALQTMVDLIQSRFEAFFEKDDLRLNSKESVSGRYLVINQRTKIEFPHDFFTPTLTDEEFAKNKEKYRRRIERFYETIEQSSSVCLLCSMSCVSVERSQLLEAYRKIRAVFPNGTLDIFFVLFDDISNDFEEIPFEGDGTLYLRHVNRARNNYDIQERTHEFAWFDRVCLTDKFKSKTTSLYGAQSKTMTWWERIHYKIYRHMHKWLERHGVLRIRYDD